MKYIFYIFKSKYCLIVFILSLFLGYSLVPKAVFYGWYTILAIIFITLFALSITCIIRNVKEKILLAKTYKSSVIGIIATAVGIVALQTCGVGAPVCGAAVGLGIVSSIFPSVLVWKISKYAIDLMVISIAFQLLALYFMNCFKRFKQLNIQKI